jgi:hypothetical protein
MLHTPALGIALLLAATTAVPAPGTPTKAVPARTYRIEFENAALPARQKELLARYADQIVGWAASDRLARAASQQSAKPMSMARIHEIDREWQGGADPEGLATALARNDCARALAAILVANPGYGEAFVADSQGALVCMSRRTSDYWQGDEAKWSRSWAGGTGAVFVSKVAHDDSTGVDLMHISAPITSGGHLVGVLVVGKLLTAGG